METADQLAWSPRKGATVAKGKKCPQCDTSMWAKSEKDYSAGVEVVYQCNSRTCGFEEKVFEDK